MLPKIQPLLGSCQSCAPQRTWRISDGALMEEEGEEITGAERQNWESLWEPHLTSPSPARGETGPWRELVSQSLFCNICSTSHYGRGCTSVSVLMLTCCLHWGVSPSLMPRNKPVRTQQREMAACCPAHRLCGSGIQAGSKEDGLSLLHNARGFTWGDSNGWWGLRRPGATIVWRSGLVWYPGWGDSPGVNRCTQLSHCVVPGFTKTWWELPGLSDLVLEMSESLLFLKN